MNPEQQRIAIAEACGLFRIEPLRRTTRKGNTDPEGVRLWYCKHHHGGAGEYYELPDYLNDLNAMHEAEKMLSPKNKRVYGEALATAHAAFHDDYYEGWASYEGMADGFFKLATIPASQRAETLLRTLNLWTP